MDAEQPQSPREQQERDDAVVRLLVRFFQDFVAEETVPPQKQHDVSPAHFLAWLSQRMAVQNLDQRLAYCQEARATGEVYDWLSDVAASPAGPQQVLPVWYAVALHDRPALRHPLKSITNVVFFKWQDGTVLPLSINVPEELMPAGMADGLAACVVRQQFLAGILDPVAAYGLDALHDRPGGDYGGEQHFDLVMGVLHKVLAQVRQQTDPVTFHYFEKWLRLIQGVFRPPVPARVRAGVEARKRDALARDGEAPGGWDA